MNAHQNENDNAFFRQSLLASPGERQDVEYKASIPFDADSEFGLKLVKHTLGMANIGGGWIVIGHEDGTLQPDPNHSNEVAATYDTTLLSAAVNKVVAHGQTVRLVVHKELNPRTRLVYPVIRVEGFERTPFICRSTKPDNKKPVLQEGKVYIRRPGAETTEIQTPEDWDELLKRCVSQRRGEFLAEFADMARRMLAGDATPTQDAEAALENWMDECKAASSAIQNLPEGYGYREFAQIPTRPSLGRWSLNGLKRAAESTALPRYWLDNLNPVKECVEFQTPASATLPPLALRIRTDGAFYVCILLDEPSTSYGNPPLSSRPMYVDLSIFKITWMNSVGADLYEALGIAPNDPYFLCVRHNGISGREASVHDLRHYWWDLAGFKSLENSHEWQREVTLDFAKENRRDLVARITKDLFERFNFLKVPDELITRAFNDWKPR